MKTEEELVKMAEDIAGNSDGSYHIEWGEEYDALEANQRQKVEDMVWDQIQSCGSCGWNFIIDSMVDSKHFDGELVCWRCSEDESYDPEEDE